MLSQNTEVRTLGGAAAGLGPGEPSETFNLMDAYTTTQVTVGILRRHHEGMNDGFLDGHARWVTSDQALEVRGEGRGEYYDRFIAADRG
jgi:hypothetical protein